MVYLLIIGILIIVALSIIAWRMLARVKQMELEQAEQENQLALVQKEHRDYLNSSIQILAQGILDDQLSLTEGAIRISVLLSNLKPDEAQKSEYNVFAQLAEATSHIPILDAWKRLSKKEKMNFDKERETIEARYRDFVIDAATRIRGQSF